MIVFKINNLGAWKFHFILIIIHIIHSPSCKCIFVLTIVHVAVDNNERGHGYFKVIIL